MNPAFHLPKPGEVLERIKACRKELAALQRLFRAAKAAEEADDARKERERPANCRGVVHA
jgi:hypothetical protein